MSILEPKLMSVELLSHAVTVGIFRFTLVPRETMFVPALNKANMLRGAFGHSFRKLCCVPECAGAQTCPIASSCPYKAIFEPSPPPDANRLSRNQDIPRPFVFRAPLNDKTKFQPGEEFQFDLVLIGRALDHLPYFVLSFRDLAAQGLGLNRAKCELRQVVEIKPDSTGVNLQSERQNPIDASDLIYDSANQVFHTPKALDLERWLRERVSTLSGNGQVNVRFLTPTLLKAENSITRNPEFHQLFKRLRDRINSLSTFFGSGPLTADFAGLGVRAEQVQRLSSNMQWQERFRTSSKTRQRHELSGFTGSAVYSGQLQEFLPWLALGELVHLGKHTPWGSGWIALQEDFTLTKLGF